MREMMDTADFFGMSSKAVSMVVPTRTIALSGSKSLRPSVRMGRKRSFFADWTIRHPDEPNGELLQHCGPWPCSVACERPRITVPLAFDHNGAVMAEARHGDVTLARFDGDNGEYSLLLGNAEGIDGPKGRGTYLWVKVANIRRLEAKVVEGPYIHHCTGIHCDVVPVLYEAWELIRQRRF